MTTEPSVDRNIFRGELLGLCASAAAIDRAALAEWIRELERQDAFGCFTDPTGWIRTTDARKVSLKMLRAVLQFHDAIMPKETRDE